MSGADGGDSRDSQAPSTARSEDDPELVALRRPFTAQASLKSIEKRRRSLAWSLLRADWARRVERVPMWVVAAVGTVGVTVVWQFGMVARDVRMVASQWIPVVGLGVGAALLAAVAAVAVGRVFLGRERKRLAFAAVSCLVTLVSGVWTAAAALDVRPLRGPDDGDLARVGEPFDVVGAGRDSDVYAITVVGMVEAPLSDEVVDGMYQSMPVARCWTLVGTVDLVQTPGWPWDRDTTVSGFEVMAVNRAAPSDGLSLTMMGSTESHPIYPSDDACEQDEMWSELALRTAGTGPVLFAVTFPVEGGGMPTDVEWLDWRGRLTRVSLLGGDFSDCTREAADAPGSALRETWCSSVVSLEERLPRH